MSTYGMSQPLLWAMIGTICKCFSTDNFLNWDKHKKDCFKGGGHFSLMKQLTQLTLWSDVETMCSMLGYNESQCLELFKNTLPTRYHYLLFGFQSLREAVETAKYVMT